MRRCLEKAPERRFQSARDLAFALRESPSVGSALAAVPPVPARRGTILKVAAGVVALAMAVAVALDAGRVRERLFGARESSRLRSLAVLPLQNLSGDPAQDYFADGMTDALTASLAQIRSVKVISRTSAMQYKGTKQRLRDIARELGVEAVVEGSFTRSGDSVRITAELVQGASETHLWARSFERELGDVLALQGEIAGAIAGQIEAELTVDERSRLAPKRPVAAKAYEAYLRGRFLLDEGSEEGLRGAREQFERALALQDDYAAAHAGIASYYAVLPFYSSQAPAEVFPKARAAAQKAVELDETLPEAHASLAYIRAYYEWDWAGADREFRKALDLRPNFADAHFSYSRFLAASGRMPEAIAEIRKAEELDPRELSLRANRALLSYFQGALRRSARGAGGDQPGRAQARGGSLGHRADVRREGDGDGSARRAQAGHGAVAEPEHQDLARARERALRAAGTGARGAEGARGALPHELRPVLLLRAHPRRARREGPRPRVARAGLPGALDRARVPPPRSAPRTLAIRPALPRPRAAHGLPVVTGLPRLRGGGTIAPP